MKDFHIDYWSLSYDVLKILVIVAISAQLSELLHVHKFVKKVASIQMLFEFNFFDFLLRVLYRQNVFKKPL